MKHLTTKIFIWFLKRLKAFAAIVLVFSITSGCSTKLMLPTKSPEMEKVYLIQYATWGHHSLAFYKDETLTEFTYGDWELFALNKRDWWTAWKNMTFLTQGALGKKSTPWIPGEPICNKFKGCKVAVPFLASTEKVGALHNELLDSYDKHSSTEVYNSKEDVYFVKYDVPYWGFHNCNHELANWLEKIGVEVSGKLLYEPRFIEGMKTRQSQ